MKDKLSKSVVRRLQVVKGDNWWVDDSKQNGIGPVCIFCKRLIDWPPTDHGKKCPMWDHVDMNQEPPEWA